MLGKCLHGHMPWKQRRSLSTELAAALRPFYFAVHPDLFEQHPVQRAVNEESLKQLNAHIEVLSNLRYNEQQKHCNLNKAQKTLQFYIRTGNVIENRDNFKLITLNLNDDVNLKDPQTIIERLLELCNLSTEYIRKLRKQSVHRLRNQPSGNQEPNVYRRQTATDHEYEYEYFNDFEESFQEVLCVLH